MVVATGSPPRKASASLSRRSGPGVDEADDEDEDREEAERPWVAAGKTRGRQAGLERVEGREQPLAVREPQRLRGGIGRADGDGVGEGRRRPVEHAGRLLDAGSAAARAGARSRKARTASQTRGDDKTGEDDEADRVRNDPPQAEPGDDGEQAGEDEDGCDHRPHRFPKEDQPGTPDGALDSAAGRGLDAGGNACG